MKKPQNITPALYYFALKLKALEDLHVESLKCLQNKEWYTQLTNVYLTLSGYNLKTKFPMENTLWYYSI